MISASSHAQFTSKGPSGVADMQGASLFRTWGGGSIIVTGGGGGGEEGMVVTEGGGGGMVVVALN